MPILRYRCQRDMRVTSAYVFTCCAQLACHISLKASSLAFGNRTVYCEEAQERAEEAPLLGESPSDFPVILLKVVSEA